VLTNLDELMMRWRREGVRLLPPPDEREVFETLRRTGRPFARDVVGLYRTTGGMEDGGMDDECLTLWTLGRVLDENLKRSRPELLFMDFLIDSHAYGLRREDDETSSVHVEYFDGGPLRRVADSLDEFFRLRLTNSLRLFL
jgi:hypothetical protein